MYDGDDVLSDARDDGVYGHALIHDVHDENVKKCVCSLHRDGDARKSANDDGGDHDDGRSVSRDGHGRGCDDYGRRDHGDGRRGSGIWLAFPLWRGLLKFPLLVPVEGISYKSYLTSESKIACPKTCTPTSSLLPSFWFGLTNST